LEKNWRRKEKQLAYSVQAIDLIGAPIAHAGDLDIAERLELAPPGLVARRVAFVIGVV